jgi:nucleoside-diphosphate-sugar epimerase
LSKILVTGGAGFIGYNISKILAENSRNEVLILDNLSKGDLDDDLSLLLDRENVEFLNIDLCDPAGIAKLDGGFDRIYHLAATVGVRKVMENPVQTLRNNTLSTIYLLDHIMNIEGNKPHILFTSSCENYAGSVSLGIASIPTPEEIPLCIDDVTNPRWTYASSKILGEIAFIHYAREIGVKFNIIRYHNVYGPRMGYSHVIPDIHYLIFHVLHYIDRHLGCIGCKAK